MTKRVLVVENEHSIQAVLCSILAFAQCEVEVADDGRMALEKIALSSANATSPDLIFLDLMMPRMDGTSFVQELRRRQLCANVPIVVISGDPSVREQVRDLDMDIYIGKPFTMDDVLDVVNALIGEPVHI